MTFAFSGIKFIVPLTESVAKSRNSMVCVGSETVFS